MEVAWIAPISPILAVAKLWYDTRVKVISFDRVYTEKRNASGCRERYFLLEFTNRTGGLSPNSFVKDICIPCSGEFARHIRAHVKPKGFRNIVISHDLRFADDQSTLIIPKELLSSLCNRGDKLHISGRVSSSRSRPYVESPYAYILGGEIQEHIGPLPHKHPYWLMQWAGLIILNFISAYCLHRAKQDMFAIYLFVVGYIGLIVVLYYGFALGALFGLARFMYIKFKCLNDDFRLSLLLQGPMELRDQHNPIQGLTSPSTPPASRARTQ